MEYQRPSSLKPTSSGFCPGCMHSLATKLIADVLDDMGQQENSVHVVPVGCATLNLAYWKGDLVGAAHGRAPAVATGFKRTNPDRLVFAYQGDGDCAAIGLAEIMGAANRGENFTVIFFNNQTYGMTGGQMAPTTLIGQKTTTTRDGRDPLTTLEAPSYIARFALNTPKGCLDAKKAIKKALTLQLENKGFSFIELLGNCPTNWGLTPLQTLDYMNTNTIPYFVPGVYKDKYAEVK